MGNYFQNFYQARKAGLPPGSQLGLAKKYAAIEPTDKQRKYHASLVAFCKEHDVPLARNMERPRNKSEYSGAISSMNTLLRKYSLLDEFYGRKETTK